jgi:carbon-monoxide dehydrogenase medium subunit
VKPPPFELERPTNVEEATSLLQRPGAVALAGGQSLIPALCLRERRAALLVDLTRLEALRGVSLAEGVLRIGAGVPMWELERERLIAEHAPLLARALSTVGAPAIRARATLGGAVAWSDPTSQLPAALLALQTTLITTVRRIALQAFFTGAQRNALARGELIVALELPSTAGGGGGLRHLRRSAITWPVIGAAASVRCREGVIADARIALYGAGERPLLAEAAAGSLRGQPAVGENLQAAAALARDAARPLDDERASARYRAAVLPALVHRALAEAVRTA